MGNKPNKWRTWSARKSSQQVTKLHQKARHFLGETEGLGGREDSMEPVRPKRGSKGSASSRSDKSNSRPSSRGSHKSNKKRSKRGSPLNTDAKVEGVDDEQEVGYRMDYSDSEEVTDLDAQ